MDLSNFTLNNGLKIPSIGFGTWELPEGEKTACAVKTALSVGYRHIDTAAAYEMKGVWRRALGRQECAEKMFLLRAKSG